MREEPIIINIIINGITCPLTVLLNVLVIMAVKRRPGLQTNTNILLACLAATDVFIFSHSAAVVYFVWNTGVTGREDQKHCCRCTQLFPSFPEHMLIAASGVGYQWETYRNQIYHALHLSCHRAKHETGCFHALVISSFVGSIPWLITDEALLVKVRLRSLIAFVMISCVLFISSAYAILSQGEAERFLKESNSLKTTVFVVGAVVLCFLPAIFYLLLEVSMQKLHSSENFNFLQWVRTFVMLNSFLNSLIYCWRLKEMRRFVFRTTGRPVAVGHSNL